MQVHADTIILCGGEIDFYHLPVSSNTSKSMIPVNGKPVIGWILDDLLEKQIQSAIIVLRSKDHTLTEFLERVYKSRMSLNLVKLDSSDSIVYSLKKGLEQVRYSKVRVILGDTLIKDSFDLTENFVYLHEVIDSHRWCLARYNGDRIITEYFEKIPDAPLPHETLCGFYAFQDSKHLEVQTEQCLAEGKKQISDVLSAYQISYPIKARTATQWFDFGNMDNLVAAKQKLLQSRYFNTLTVDPVLNTITKVSEFDQKLQDELNWYESLPDKLKVVAPRIISKEQVNGKLNLVTEYYGYPTLAELYLYSDIHPETWQSIINRLMLLHQSLVEFKGNLSEEDFMEVYVHKTLDRVKNLLDKDESWQEIFSYEHILCNGNLLLNYPALEEKIITTAKRLCQNYNTSIIHGDFCFSNILYDLNSHIIRLIDPRGSFGKKGIYGDPRYDIAKLRHSISGSYDFIVADLFEINQINNSFEITIFAKKESYRLEAMFDESIQKRGYNVKEIKFIEGLLFISMMPLHQDKPLRQKAMFLTGLTRLNKVLT